MVFPLLFLLGVTTCATTVYGINQVKTQSVLPSLVMAATTCLVGGLAFAMLLFVKLFFSVEL